MAEILTILSETPNYPIIRWVIYICLWIGFFFFLLWLKYVYSTKSWPKVTGEIIRSKVNGKHGSNATTHYSLDLQYSYSVGNENFIGSRRRYLDVRGNHRRALDEFVEKHPKGSLIDVYYNPKKPKVSVLIPGIVFTGLILLSLFFLMAISINSIPIISVLSKAGIFS